MAEVVVNITANTGQATDGVDNLNKSLNQTDQSAAALETTLKKQEAQIKIIDGAINLLGGSVELLAGGLALSGAVTEEQAKQFETAAIGAIAFADGAKRTLDGIKNLNEGLKVYGGVAGVAKKAQVALNAAVLANPWVALAAVVAAVGVALVVYYNSQLDAEEATKSGTAAIEAQIDAKERLKEETERLRAVDSEYTKGLGNESKEIQRQLNLLQAKGASEEDLLAKKKELIQSEISELNKRLGNISDNAELESEIRNQLLDAENKRNVAQAEFDRKRLENSEKVIELVKQETIEVLNYKDAVNQRNQAIKEGIELFIQETGGIEQTNGVIMRQLPMVQGAVEESSATLGDYFNNLITKQNEFFESEAGKAASSTLSVASNLAKTLSENIDESNKEGFEKGKKYRIAETRITSVQAAFEAYKGLIGVPYVGQFLAIAGAAAALAAGQKAIKGIQSSTFGGSGSPSNPAGSPVNANFPAVNTGFQGGGQFLPNTAPQGTPPIRAYVVTGDVTNGQVAEQQLQTRRRFG